MKLDREEGRDLLRQFGLRSTAPRLAVLQVLAAAENPLSHTEVVTRLGETDFDPATVYRNLIKLKDVGVLALVGRVEGIDRYALATGTEDTHQHAHFVCEDCGKVACLPEEVTASMRVKGPWAKSVSRAMVQLRGDCPDCLRGRTKAS